MEQKEINEELDLDLLNLNEELNKIPLSLTRYIDVNLETILSIIKKYPRNKKIKIDISNLSDDVELSDTAYKTLANHIQKKFPEYIINSSTLSSIITRVKRRRGLIKQRDTKKIVQQPGLITQEKVHNQVADSQLLHDKSFVIVNENNRPQKQNEDESSSVGDQKIDKGFESQPVSRVGNLSTGQVSQAQIINILNEEEENTLLKCSNIYFSYVKLINKIDRDSKLNQNFGVYEEEVNMENLVKIIFKVFEIDYFSGNYGILKDGQRRKQKLDNSDVSQKVKKFGAQIWGRMDLIDMLIDRKKRANTPG